MEKISNYKSVLLDVLKNTNYERLILCENINGPIISILSVQGIKFQHFKNINVIDIELNDKNFLIISFTDHMMCPDKLYQKLGELLLAFPNNILVSSQTLNENYLDDKTHKTR